MFVILAVDALEYELVKKFECKNIMQEHCGKTDISDFSAARTVVLWSSFISGKNMEKEVVAPDGKSINWNFQVPHRKTFFSKFNNPFILDMPGYNYDITAHRRSRELLKKYFEVGLDKKESILKEYNSDTFKHHRNIKKRFIEALEMDYDLVVGYFSFIDVIGHLNFGNTTLMRMLYREIDELAEKIRKDNRCLLIISDHGMKALGKNYGEHTDYGYWSTNFQNLGNPKLINIHEVIKNAN